MHAKVSFPVDLRRSKTSIMSFRSSSVLAFVHYIDLTTISLFFYRKATTLVILFARTESVAEIVKHAVI